ncbi:MAG: hypothetical protein O9264_15285 [Leptospira sp.]|nr:hypothetical protein [Leptospira sp.]
MHQILFSFLCFLFFFANSILAEEVVTTKKDEPDGYYGLRLGAIITPTYGHRMRDSASGISDTSQSDRTGFSMPWTLVSISKEWENTGIKVEFWGEVLKANALSADTSVDGGTKSNPHIFAIRRANVQKLWEHGQFRHRLIFGMQELPHMFSVWGGYYDWRYMERSPLESLGFSADPVDLGLSYHAEWKSLSAHIALVNGEGYRSLQNANGTGYDAIGRVSWQNRWSEEFKTGIHFLARRGNAFGNAGNECVEAKTRCLPSDNNANTRLKGDLSLAQDQTVAMEANLLYLQYINLGLGGMAKKQFAGQIRDTLSPFILPVQRKESIGRGAYAWLGLGNGKFRIVFRGEIASGGPNQGLRTTETVAEEPWVRLTDLNTLKTPVYSDKSYYVTRQVYFEYIPLENVRYGIGYFETRSFDAQGTPNKYYIDNFSEERTVSEYRSQFSTPSFPLISEYGRLDRNLVIKVNLVF